MAATVHIYEIFINATPERVWQALTDPEFTEQYFHRTRFESTFEPGAGHRFVMPDGTDGVDGIVEECDPPHRLVITWRVLYDTAMAAEPPGRVEWKLVPATEDRSVTRVTLRHGDLALSPLTRAHVRLGWVEIIDSLKTLLETGRPLASVDTTDSDTTGGDPDDVAAVEGQWHRSQGIAAHNAAWDLLDGRSHTPDEAVELLASAHAAGFHWARAAGRGAANDARAAWLISRCYAVLGHGAPALEYADRCTRFVEEAALADFDDAYAHEARARALACLGRLDEARTERERADATPIADPEDLAIFAGDLSAEPWFGLSADSGEVLSEVGN
jgi:uncharacterized protein YndB with AHSA1/START domain